ncbi:MAG: lipase family protein [Candidatus Nanopelagicales bacterium]
MPSSRTKAVLAAGVAAVVGGALLFVTAPATSLVDAPMYQVPQEVTDSIDTSVTPEVSSFYDVAGWQAGPPGQLVRAEPIDGAPPGTKLYRIMYQSTDLRGNAIPVTGLYAVPDGPAPAGGFPLIGFAHGTTGVAQACGMSQAPLTPNTPGYSAWVPHIEPLVRQGWAVVASDYSGMGAPGPSSYLVGPLEGRGVLDSMRAVLQPSPLVGSVPIDAGKLGIYGKSQGGEAALSAMELAPTYAPELDIAGGVSLAPGFTPALQGVLNAVAGNPTSTSQNMFVLLIAKSFAENYPQYTNIDAILSDEGKQRLTLLEQYCGTDLADRVVDIPLSQMLNSPVDSGLVTALDEAMPGSTALQMPAMIVQGLKDKTILPQFTHAQVMSRCALGDVVWYVRYPEDDHPSINFQARETQPSVIDWMQARWAGEPAPDNCANQLLGTASTTQAVNP